MTLQQHIWDVFVKSSKTFVEAYTAFVLAGGFNILHVSAGVELLVSAIAFLATAILNVIIKIHNVVTTKDDVPATLEVPAVVTSSGTVGPVASVEQAIQTVDAISARIDPASSVAPDTQNKV